MKLFTFICLFIYANNNNTTDQVPVILTLLNWTCTRIRVRSRAVQLDPDRDLQVDQLLDQSPSLSLLPAAPGSVRTELGSPEQSLLLLRDNGSRCSLDAGRDSGAEIPNPGPPSEAVTAGLRPPSPRSGSGRAAEGNWVQSNGSILGLGEGSGL